MVYLPKIIRCGFFDSGISFPNIEKTKPRTVEHFELELFSEESGVAVLNHAKHPITQGCLLLAKPGDVRYSYLDFKTHFIHFSVTDPELFAQIQSLPSFIHLSEYKEFSKSFLKIHKLFHSIDRFDKIAACARLVSLLESMRYLENGDSDNKSTLNKAKKFINQNYAEEISVRSIAEHCNISETHLYRIFKNDLFTSPNEYLLETRLSNARLLLCNTNLSVNEIAMDCGFRSQSYFSDCFKRKSGISPLQFRQLYKYEP